MKQQLLLVTLCVSLAMATVAQSPVATNVPSVTTEVLANGRSGELAVTNKGQTAITAMHLSFDCGRNEHSFFDSVLYDFEPIRPLKTWTYPFQSPIRSCASVVDAAIFADGHSEGDLRIIGEIYSNRLGYDKGLALAIPIVDTVAKSGDEQHHAVASLVAKSKQIHADRGINLDERIGESSLLYIVSDCLEKGGWPRPQFEVGRPDGPEVATVMRSENLNHTQAAAYVLRSKLMEWETNLHGHLGTD